MRRPAIGVAAAVLALALAPGAALGFVPPGALDQSADYGGSTYMFDDLAGVTQTVTPGHTGVLTHLELYCDPGLGSPVDVNVHIGLAATSSSCASAGWLEFYLVVPVVAGQQFTIAIDAAGTPISLGEAAAGYPGGAADCTGVAATVPEACPTDFAFKTYVFATVATTYSWSLASVAAGTSTAVTLTTQTAFDDMVDSAPVAQTGGGPGTSLPANFYSMKLGALPAWFSPTGITCSAQVAAADCTVAKYQAGINPSGDGTAMTVIITITGQASPAAADAGGTGTASGQGCVAIAAADVVGVTPNQTVLNVCAPGSANLGVGAAVVTPAPTSTATASVSRDGPLSPLLAFGVATLAGLLVAFLIRSRRRRAVTA